MKGYVVRRDGMAYAEFTYEADAAAYLEGARESDPSASWTLERAQGRSQCGSVD